ncbi:dNTP triphosphohydrolase [Segetibacter sp. 3557_3]|nr:dNTP triphosphohydrolase [Segetibacter sp. 3557_3]
MQWERIFSADRIGHTKVESGPRSGFQKDYDRLIFSSAFRRLQNKTQVFPLPGSTFVHNRLTHSLEVASVGRSLGNIVGQMISCEMPKETDSYEFYKYELANVIAAGCLAHDIGNPAFGHSGEKAISAYFTTNAGLHIEGTPLRSFFDERQWADLSNFEGNANSLRILTHRFKGRFQYGLGLTYTTLGSIIKYPCEATAMDSHFKHRKKYGFFQSEKEAMHEIATRLGIPLQLEYPVVYSRHPFVYLVEAADDICYRVIDMEDAHRLGILPHHIVKESFLDLIEKLKRSGDNAARIKLTCDKIDDGNERISYLRARVINSLTAYAAEVFWNNRRQVLAGGFNDTLLDVIETECDAFSAVMALSNEKIYNHDTVLEIEIAGYNVMAELLQLFVPALLKEAPDHKDKKILKLFPMQYREFEQTKIPYERAMNAFDVISGMTDLFATELYRKLKGIDIPQHR